MSESGRRSARREQTPAAAAASSSGDNSKQAATASKGDSKGNASASPSSAASSSPLESGAAISAAPASSSSSGPSAGSKRSAKSIRASDSKRKKLVPRCTSPSHFLIDTGNDAQGAPLHSASVPSALNADPAAPSASKLADSAARVDQYLNAIGGMYYRNHAAMQKDGAGGGAEVWVSSDYDKLEYPTLDLLLSPLRKPHVLDLWCPREIALFEAGICAVGKDFHAIANLIGTKDCKECVDFYYIWKKSSHYAMWKNFGKPSKKWHSNKVEQWKAIREQMGTDGAAAGAKSALATAAPNGVKKEL